MLAQRSSRAVRAGARDGRAVMEGGIIIVGNRSRSLTRNRNLKRRERERLRLRERSVTAEPPAAGERDVRKTGAVQPAQVRERAVLLAEELEAGQAGLAGSVALGLFRVLPGDKPLHCF